jgi:hypothetical protein
MKAAPHLGNSAADLFEKHVVRKMPTACRAGLPERLASPGFLLRPDPDWVLELVSELRGAALTLGR